MIFDFLDEAIDDEVTLAKKVGEFPIQLIRQEIEATEFIVKQLEEFMELFMKAYELPPEEYEAEKKKRIRQIKRDNKNNMNKKEVEELLERLHSQDWEEVPIIEDFLTGDLRLTREEQILKHFRKRDEIKKHKKNIDILIKGLKKAQDKERYVKNKKGKSI